MWKPCDGTTESVSEASDRPVPPAQSELDLVARVTPAITDISLALIALTILTAISDPTTNTGIANTVVGALLAASAFRLFLSFPDRFIQEAGMYELPPERSNIGDLIGDLRSKMGLTTRPIILGTPKDIQLQTFGTFRRAYIVVPESELEWLDGAPDLQDCLRDQDGSRIGARVAWGPLEDEARLVSGSGVLHHDCGPDRDPIRSANVCRDS